MHINNAKSFPFKIRDLSNLTKFQSPFHKSPTRNFIHISTCRTQQQQPKSHSTHITNNQVGLGIPPNQFHQLQLSVTVIHM